MKYPRFPRISSIGAIGMSALWLGVISASADLTGPYTADANTLYLFHFNETGVAVTANAGSKGGNLITVTNDSSFDGLAGILPQVSTLLGYASYTGFGAALSATNIDGSNGAAAYDGNADGQFTADQNNIPSADEIVLTNLNFGLGAGNSPWTLEALIRPTTLTPNQEIICTDGHNQRGFQFRIGGGQLEFNLIGIINPKFPIPTTGPHAFVPSTWYHVALTYDGATLRMYWTKLDPSVGAANQIGSTAWTAGANAGTPLVPFVIGDEARGGFGEPFLGLIDEVRISSVARAANGMQFFSPAVTISKDPTSQNIDNGAPVKFEVLASSTTALGYRWRYNGTPIAGALNTNSYTITSVDLTNAGNYDVIITNQTGSSATSQVAVLTVGAGNFLAHRWSFTADTTDSVGGATGITQGNATVNSGALVLDGTADTYMELPPYLLSGLTAVTFDFWATFGVNSDNNRVFDFGNTNFVNPFVPPPQNYVFFSPRAGGGVHNLGITGASSESQQTLSGAGILDGQTVHITCVIDPPNSRMAIYTNGVLEVVNTNLNVALVSLNDELCWIGRSLFVADPYLNGSIDELRIYGGALAAASVAQSHLLGPNALLSEGAVQLVKEPVDTATAAGQQATFTAAATGHLPVTYQWYENSVALSGATNADYTFVAAAGQAGHTFQVRATNAVAGVTYHAVSSNAALTINVPETKAWLGVNGPNWDTVTANWTNTTSLTTFKAFDFALFDSRGSSQPNVDVVQAINLSGLTANAATDYLIDSSAQNGSLNGNGALVKQGAGKLTLNVPNNLSAGASIQSGTLQIGNGGGNGTIGGGNVTNNGSLVFNRTNQLTVANVISGSGQLAQIGSGNTVVSGSNSYSGLTVISGGTLNARNATALGTAAAGTVATNGGQLYVDVNVDMPGEALTLGGNARAALRKGGAGVTTLGGTVNLVEDTMIQLDGGATLNLTNAAGISGSGRNLTLAGADTTSIGTIRGAVTLGAGSITNTGGAWTLNSLVNNYSGKTYIAGGRLSVGAPAALGTAPGVFTADQITLNGGSLGAWTNYALNDGLRGITVGPDTGGGLYVASGATLAISNPISGFFPLTKSGPGTAVVTDTSSQFFGELYTDTASTADDGILRVNNPFLQLLGGIFIRNNNAGRSTLQLDGTAENIVLSQAVQLSGRNNTAPAIESVGGTNLMYSGVTFTTGGGQYRIGCSTGQLEINTTIPAVAPAGDRSLILEGDAIILVSGSVQDGGATLQLRKEGKGTTLLTGFSTISGGTFVNDGVLRVDGGITCSNLMIVGGALAGSGTTYNNVTAISGTGSGTIDNPNVSGNYTIAGQLVVDVNRAGFLADLAAVTGTITGNTGAGIAVTNLGSPLQVGDTFTLFNKAVVNGAAMGISGGGVTWNNNLAVNGTVSVAAIGVPQPNITSATSGSGVFTFSGNNGPAGGAFSVLTSTNVSLPLVNWVVETNGVFSGSGTFNVSIAIQAGQPAKFYQLRIP